MNIMKMYINGLLAGVIAVEDNNEAAWDKIARFIVTAGGNVVITDALDRLIVSTFGPFIDRVRSKSERITLMKYLLPYQTGEKDAIPLAFIEVEGEMVEKGSIGAYRNLLDNALYA